MATKIITIASSKGGSGKTTLSTNLAYIYSLKHSCLLIDCDYKQQLSNQWFNNRDGDENLISMEAYNIESLEDIIKKAKAINIDYIIIDTAGSDDNLVNRAIDFSDYCLIPCGSGGFDIPATKTTISIVTKLNKKASIVLTKCVSSSNDEKNARLAFSGSGVPVCKYLTSNLQAYKDAALFNQSVLELNSSKKASNEITALYKWLNTKLKSNSLQNKMDAKTNVK